MNPWKSYIVLEHYHSRLLPTLDTNMIAKMIFIATSFCTLFHKDRERERRWETKLGPSQPPERKNTCNKMQYNNIAAAARRHYSSKSPIEWKWAGARHSNLQLRNKALFLSLISDWLLFIMHAVWFVVPNPTEFSPPQLPLFPVYIFKK